MSWNFLTESLYQSHQSTYLSSVFTIQAHHIRRKGKKINSLQHVCFEIWGHPNTFSIEILIFKNSSQFEPCTAQLKARFILQSQHRVILQ